MDTQFSAKMSSYKQKQQPSKPSGMAEDLFIAGDSALVTTTQQPSLLQYRGVFYEHSSLPYQNKTQEQNGQRLPLVNQFFTNTTKDLIHEQTVEYPAYNDHGRQSRGGFFNQQSPLFNNETYTRPQSSVSRPVSAYSVGEPYSRPNSAIRKGSSRLEGCRGYSPSHNRTHTISPDLQIDPDHEPIADVLNRLGDFTHNFVPASALAYTDCECTCLEERVPSRLARVYCSDEEVEEEEDIQAVPLDVLFRTFKQYKDKGHSVVRQKAMFTLINTSSFDKVLSHNELEKVMMYMVQGVPQVKEACLVLVKQLVKQPSNLQYFLDRDILAFINNCLISQDLSALRRQALLLAEEIFMHQQFKEIWLQFVNMTLLPKLLSMVRGQIPLDVKYAACCVFRSLTQYEEFIGYAMEDILPSVILLRNASAKFKEVYVEILTTVLSHTDIIPPDLVDSSAIPITVSIIREGPCGPQCAALHLLTSLTVHNNGVAVVIGTDGLVPMIMCCMKDSHCRKVKLNALKVMKNLCKSRKIGLCKDLMLQFSGSLLPSIEEDSLTYLSQATSKSPSPVKPRFDEERHMWQGLERFIDLLKDVLYREGKVETDDLGLVVAVHLKPCVDVGQTQLQLLTYTVEVLHDICVWPLDKSRLGFSANRIDLTGFSDNDKQRAHFSKINRGLTQSIWDKAGTVASDLLRLYAEKLEKHLQGSSKLYDLSTYFESEEIQLIKSLLNFILCTSLCTCVTFPNLTPKLEESSKKKSKSKLKSSSSSNVSPENCRENTHAKLKSQSDVGPGFRSEEDKLWVKENPHLTHMNSSTSGPNARAVAKSKADLQHKEACTDRRLLRKCLYEAGVFASVCPFLKCSQADIQVLVLQILRCLVHPLEERVAPKLFYTSHGSSSKPRQRPQTAGASPDANKRLNMALHKMSPEIAKLIGEALVPEEHKAEEGNKDVLHVEKKVLNQPESTTGGLNTIHERLQDYTEAAKEEKLKKEEAKKLKERPVIDRCRPIALQCRESVLSNTRDAVLNGIFNKSQSVRKQSLLLLHDMVLQGEVDIHMKLSTHSCIPKLIDFLRVNENNEFLEIIGLIVARILVSSDTRLRDLFNRHGGQQLLLSMAQYTSGLIKQEVSTTLKTISKLEVPMKRRPVSAPVYRQIQKQKVPDIWDHIQERWKHEDQVTVVLRKFSMEDKELHRKK